MVELFCYSPVSTMQQVKFDYSTKDIPIPSQPDYARRMIEKVGSLVHRMRWKAFFFLKKNPSTTSKETFGFKSSRPTPFIPELKPFEDGIYDLIANIKTKTTRCAFQDKLREDARNIRNSADVFVAADKTRNFYKVSKDQYDELITTSVTKAYKKAPKNSFDNVNAEASTIASDLDLDDRIDVMAKRNAFLTLKDHKANFDNDPTCRLLNPAKSELGLISKAILDKITSAVKQSTKANQWKSTAEAINWFKAIQNKHECSFMMFD